MRIEIAERLKPYSSLPGTSFLLPLTTLKFTIYPTRIDVVDLSAVEDKHLGHIDITVQGPVKNFHVEQDLEKPGIKVWGHALQGFFRYKIIPSAIQAAPFHIEIEKAYPQFSFSASSKVLADCLSNENAKTYKPVVTARLSLGNHKAQDCQLILRRLDMKEILPLWFRLGQLLPHDIENVHDTHSLLGECQAAIHNRQKENLLSSFENVFLAGFGSFLCPRAHDADYQGFALPIMEKNHRSLLSLLRQGAKEIGRLFFQTHENCISILPILPPELHCGRLIDLQHADGKCSIEWSKKLAQRMIFFAENDCDLYFHFQKDIQHFRLRENDSEKGQLTANGSLITLRKGNNYFFDRFE